MENVNRLPVLGIIKAQNTDENQLITITPVVFDPDNDTIELSIENTPEGHNFSDGEFSWIPDFDF